MFGSAFAQSKGPVCSPNEETPHSCTLYKDYLVVCFGNQRSSVFNNSQAATSISIYNLKLQRMEQKQRENSDLNLLNPSAFVVEEKQKIILYGRAVARNGPGFFGPTYSDANMTFYENSKVDHLEYKLTMGMGGPALPSPISYVDQGKMYVYQANDTNANFGSLYNYCLKTTQWTNCNTNFDNLTLDNPCHNAVFSDGALYLFTRNKGSPSLEDYHPIEAVYMLNLREDPDHLNWEKMPSLNQGPGCLKDMSFTERNGMIYVFGTHEQESVLWRYDTRSREWSQIQDIGMLAARSNQKAVVYEGQLLIIDWHPSNSTTPPGIQYYNLTDEDSSSLKNNNNETKSKRRDICRDRSEDFMKHTKDLYKSKIFPDITFEVEGEEIPAHKAILASRSDYFMKMFTSGMSEAQSNKISIPNMKPDVFHAVLQYFYCHEVELDEQLALALIPVVDEYLIKGLKKICEGYLSRKLTKDNVVGILEVADRYETEELRRVCFDFIVSNMDTIDREKELTKLSKSLLIELLNFSTSPSQSQANSEKKGKDQISSHQSQSSNLFSGFSSGALQAKK